MAYRICGNECALRSGFVAVIGSLHHPTGHIVERFPLGAPSFKDRFEFVLLLGGLPCEPEVRRISTDINLSTLIFEINMCLIERRLQ
jgi:hypothetical protein